jgi:DNA repair protein RecO (recombination protein O)
MPIVTTESVVLQVFPYGDTSKILRLLTATHGVRGAMAKGALRPRSRFGGLLELFASGVSTLYIKDARELQTLSAFELTRSHQRLGSDLLRFGGASLVAEIVLRTASEEPQPHLYQHFLRTLARIQDCDMATRESEILAGTWALIALLGYAPDLDVCLACGRSLDEAEEVRFDYAAGGVHCLDCAQAAPGKRLPAHARAALARFNAGDAVVLEESSGHWRLLSNFLDHHVLEGSSLKSLGFLSEMLHAERCAS